MAAYFANASKSPNNPKDVTTFVVCMINGNSDNIFLSTEVQEAIKRVSSSVHSNPPTMPILSHQLLFLPLQNMALIHQMEYDIILQQAIPERPTQSGQQLSSKLYPKYKGLQAETEKVVLWMKSHNRDEGLSDAYWPLNQKTCVDWRLKKNPNRDYAKFAHFAILEKRFVESYRIKLLDSSPAALYLRWSIERMWKPLSRGSRVVKYVDTKKVVKYEGWSWPDLMQPVDDTEPDKPKIDINALSHLRDDDQFELMGCEILKNFLVKAQSLSIFMAMPDLKLVATDIRRLLDKLETVRVVSTTTIVVTQYPCTQAGLQNIAQLAKMNAKIQEAVDEGIEIEVDPTDAEFDVSTTKMRRLNYKRLESWQEVSIIHRSRAIPLTTSLTMISQANDGANNKETKREQETISTSPIRPAQRRKDGNRRDAKFDIQDDSSNVTLQGIHANSSHIQ
jgi:hypothetical protein